MKFRLQWVLAWIFTLLVLSAGCGRRRAPITADVPSVPNYVPGEYLDVNPKWSHDGSRIAFLRSTPNRKLQLYIVDSELERPLALLESELVSPDRPYAPEQMRYSSPDSLAWSPDDRMLAFERVEWFTFEDGDRIPGTGLWAFDMLTGLAKPLAIHPSHYTSYYYFYHSPEWSPDGKYLAFVGEGVNGQRRVFTHPVHGQRALTASSRFDLYDDSDWPGWRPTYGGSNSQPNKSQIAFRQGIRRNQLAPPTETIRVFAPGDAQEATCRQLLRVPENRFPQMAGEPLHKDERAAPRTGGILWSPNGQKVAFTLTPSARDYGRYEVWTMSADGRNLKRVSPRNGRGYLAPVWIGNEKLGALSPAGTQFDVVVLSPGTGSVSRLGVIGGSDCDWSPDRSQIVWSGPRAYSLPDADEPTNLHVLSTGIDIRTWSKRSKR